MALERADAAADLPADKPADGGSTVDVVGGWSGGQRLEQTADWAAAARRIERRGGGAGGCTGGTHFEQA